MEETGLLENARYLTDEQRYTHTFDADKLDDIKIDAGAKGQTVEQFLADITRRVADVTQNFVVPDNAEILMTNTPGKIVLTLRWMGSALDAI